MTAISTGSHPRLMLPGITTLFGDNYNLLDPIHQKVFMKKMSQRNFEEAVQLIGAGPAERKGQGEAVSVDATKQGYARRTYHEVWTKHIKITMEAFDDNLYLNQAEVLSKELAKAIFDAKETNASNWLNNLTSTSTPYKGADGVAVLSSAHTVGRGGTWSNLVNSDISELAIENARNQIAGWVDNSGRLMKAKIKGLIIPPQQSFNVHRILKSDKRSGQLINDTNALRDMGTIPMVTEWNYITQTAMWAILTDIDGLVYYERMAQKPTYAQEERTYDHIYGIMERYSFDCYDPHSIIGFGG